MDKSAVLEIEKIGDEIRREYYFDLIRRIPMLFTNTSIQAKFGRLFLDNQNEGIDTSDISTGLGPEFARTKENPDLFIQQSVHAGLLNRTADGKLIVPTTSMAVELSRMEKPILEIRTRKG